MYFTWAIVLLVAALLLLFLSTRRRRGLGIPEGRVIYSDSGAEHRVESPLFADDLLLLGKPDYLVESAQGLVPVEVKSGRTPTRPFQSHIFQLAAYCLLVQRNFKKRPPFGIIRYPERSFTVEFTRELEQQLLDLLQDMRTGLLGAEMHRSHRQAGRCNSCGFRELCDQRL
jgi:CRISPR-associated exonuclease Cas4